MLTMSGPSRAPATAANPITEAGGQQPEGESPGGSRVWPLRPAWRPIVRAALALGPVTMRAGDSLCRLVLRVPLRGPGSPGRDVLVSGLDGLEVDTTGLACGMATQSTTADGQAHRGLAFFDHHGHAVLKIDLGDGASPEGFHDLVRRFSPGVADKAVHDRDEPGLGFTMSGHGLTAQGWFARHQTVARMDILLKRRAESDLAEMLPCDAILEVLRHASHARIPMTATRLSWPAHGVDRSLAGALRRCRAGLCQGARYRPPLVRGPRGWAGVACARADVARSHAIVRPAGTRRGLTTALAARRGRCDAAILRLASSGQRGPRRTVRRRLLMTAQVTALGQSLKQLT